MAEIKYQRPKLYKKQQEAIFDPARTVCIEASTKAGKTHGCMVWLLEKSLLGKEGQHRWWIAPVYPQAEIAYRRMKDAVRKLPIQATENPPKIILPNGAYIWFKSAEKPDNLYGEDVYDAVLDEASRAREEAYHAIRSTLTATRGALRMIGNVKGRKNFFYTLSRKAQSGAPDMAYHKLTAYDAVEGGVLALEEIEAAKRDLPENIFRELYLAEPSDDGGNPFGLNAIERALRPMSLHPTVAYGVDLAKSVDWTVIVGLDEYGNVSSFERFQKPWEHTIDVVRDVVGTRVPCMVDSTGVGDAVVERLQQGRNNIEGFKFTSTSKQQIMEGLAVALQRGEVYFPDGVISREMMEFEYEYTRTGVKYSAPSGAHDDCVCALALAVHCRNQRRNISQPRITIL